MKNIHITILRKDQEHREVPWPYDHIPRVGEHFCFSVGVSHVVTDVHYNFLESGGFKAVVTVDAADTQA